MSLESQYNQRNPAVKRIMREACELKEASEEFFARPLEDNLFEWHFTVHGSPGSEYDGGVYHGRILLPPEYPMKPPNIILLTPNGRFEINKKICLSISGHHPETWQPSWSIRTALLALIAFMSTSGRGSIGALDYTPDERRTLAKKSQIWSCETCGPIKALLNAGAPSTVTCDEKELLERITLKAEEPTEKPDEAVGPADTATETPVAENATNDLLQERSHVPLQIPVNIEGHSRGSQVACAILIAFIALLVARRMVLSLLW